ncbi:MULTISPECIES: tetratricopeptide repeat protein [unclassified Streptomyces]|uniref:tetratricopeptide repeat protein n=1 Tax=unclassified Streptomyces TaxID=2593676 RepID=UPI0036E88541
MQRAADAIDRYREVNDEWGVADALALRGAVARCAGDWHMAVGHYRQALSMFTILGDLSSAARVYRSLAEVFFTAGEFEEAIAVMHEGLSVLPDDPTLLSGLGYSLWSAGHEADALAHLNRALAVDSENPAALFARGQIHADLGRPRLALADLDRLRACVHDEVHRRADLKSARGVSLIALGRTAEGEAELEEALLLVPHRGRTQWRVAEARLREGDTERARIALRAAVASPQPLPPAHADRARRLLRRMSSARV